MEPTTEGNLGWLLTVREAAALLGISRYTLLWWVKLKKIRAVHLSLKTIRFEDETVRDWIRVHSLKKKVWSALS